MEIVLWVLAGIGVYALIRQNTMRGLRTVRAYAFLVLVEQGMTEQEANIAALAHDAETLTPEIIRAAKSYCGLEYNGSQLEMITAARIAGFMG